MATRGRKRIPDSVKALRGNPGKRARNRDEPKPAEKAPTMPPHVKACPERRKTWRYLVKELKSMGLLASSDVAIMTIYCDAWAEYVEACKQVMKTGFLVKSERTTTYYRNPLLDVKSSREKTLANCASELGLSPTSRARLHTDKAKTGKDPMSELFNRMVSRRAGGTN